MTTGDSGMLDRIVANAQRGAAERDLGYRERALKIYSDAASFTAAPVLL